MSAPEIELFWLFLIGTIAVIVLVIIIVASIIVNNRKLLLAQQEKLEEIEKSEKIYSDLFNNIPDIAYVHSFSGEIIRINTTVKDVLGYEPEQLVGKSIKSVFAPEYDYEADYYLKQILAEEKTSGIIHLKGSNEETYVFEYKNSTIYQNGKPSAIRGIARNVTERIKVEKELKRKDFLLEAVAEATNQLLSSDNYINGINKALAILGSATDVDRVYIFENHIHPETKNLLMSQRFEWCKESAVPQIDNLELQNLPYDSPIGEIIYPIFSRGDTYSRIARNYTQPEYEILGPQGILSIIILPIYIGNRFWGFIGFDDCQTERVWTRVEESILLAAAGSIGGVVGLMNVENQLIETNTFLKSILESSSFIAVLSCNLECQITYWNAGAENLFGYKWEEIVNVKKLHELFESNIQPEPTRRGANGAIEAGSPKLEESLTLQSSRLRGARFGGHSKVSDGARRRAGGSEDPIPAMKKFIISEKKSVSRELIGTTKNNNQIWINFTMSPIIDKTGKVTGFTIIGENISKRKQAEEALRKSEELFRTVWENSADGMRLVDHDGRIVMVNPAFCNLVKIPPKKLIGQHFNIPYRAQNQKDIEIFRQRFEEESFQTRLSTTIDLVQGKDVPVEISNSFIKFGEDNNFLLSVFRDVTERKLAEKQIRESQESLRKLSAHLQNVREKERTEIAREIHDELGQLLTTLNLDMSWVESMLPKNDRSVTERLKIMSNLLDTTIATVQRISTELRPALLDDLGLIAAIEWQAKEFQNRSGIKCNFSYDQKNLDLDKDQSTTIFRIFQETLTNVARHSNASIVDISLKQTNDELILKITDNGQGISKEKIYDPKSIGIIGMKERASIHNGVLDIKSKRNKGTTVILRIPLMMAEVNPK